MYSLIGIICLILTIIILVRVAKDDDKSEKFITQATSEAVSSIKSSYPLAISDREFLKSVVSKLKERGFEKGNCIAFIDTCRDESTRPLAKLIDNEFSYSFNIAGLGGILTAGSIGFKAGGSHSPITNGKEKYVFFAFPHIAFSEKGVVGELRRPGRPKASSACGALIAIKGLAAAGKPNYTLDYDDVEFSVLQKRTLVDTDELTSYGSAGPSLVQVTNTTLKVITEDLEKTIAKAVNTTLADYAVITGVQIHSGAQVDGSEYTWEKFIDYISPSTLYTVVNGKKETFTL